MLQSHEPPYELGVIIPVYRARQALPGLLAELRTQLQGTSWHLFLVDDSGLQSTFEFLQAHCLDPRTSLVKLCRNSGQQNAVLCGIRTALPLCRSFLCMDDDGEHPVSLIPRLLAQLPAQNGLVYGVPDTQSPGWRCLGSRARNFLFTVGFHLPREITVSSFRVFTRDIGEKVAAFQGSFFYFSAVALAQRPRVSCVRYAPQQGHKASGYSMKKLAALYFKILAYYLLQLPQKPKELYRVQCIIEGE